MTRLFNRRALGVGLGGLAALFAWKGMEASAVLNTVMARMGLVSSKHPQLEKIQTLPAKSYVTAVAWSRDGSRLAAISDFGRAVTVWKSDGTRLAEFARRGTYLDNSLAFLSDDIVLTAVTDTAEIENGFAFTLWDVATKSVDRSVRERERPLFHFALSPDGRTVAALVGVSSLLLYSTRDWARIDNIALSEPGISKAPLSLVFSPDSKTIAVGFFRADQISGEVKLYNVKDPGRAAETIIVYRIESGGVAVNAVSFSPDGRFLATGAFAPIAQHGRDVAPVKVWRLADHKLVDEFWGDLTPIRQLSWSGDSRYLAVAAGDLTVRVFAPGLSQQEIAVSPQYRSAMSVSCSPDGRLLAAATDFAVTIFALSH